MLAGYLVQWEGSGTPEHVVLLRFRQRELESKTLDVVNAVCGAIDRNLGNGERIDVIAIDDAKLMTLAGQRGIALY